MFRRTAGTDDTGRVNSLPSYTSTPEKRSSGTAGRPGFLSGPVAALLND
jgi:hypothetical protein